MAADEILMEPASSLGPIDAQLTWQGKRFSAEALIEGMNKIKAEVLAAGHLNRAYVPILQSISPGDLQTAENSLNFSKALVSKWLAEFKFKTWTVHSSNGTPVTPDERQQRAEEIAAKLCNHSMWLTHGRSIKIHDLESMKLRITDYTKQPDLHDAIRRYHVLVQMSFSTNIYKLFETVESQIYRFQAQPVTPVTGELIAQIQVVCSSCGWKGNVQANLEHRQPIRPGFLPFPESNHLDCPGCRAQIDLTDARRKIEAQAKKTVVAG
jgi:hypothetical protein